MSRRRLVDDLRCPPQCGQVDTYRARGYAGGWAYHCVRYCRGDSPFFWMRRDQCLSVPPRQPQEQSVCRK